MSDTKLALAADFPPADPAAWRELVEKTLKGADFAATLVSRTDDGIEIQPLYTRSPARPGLPGSPPYLRGATASGQVAGGWDIRQLHDHPDPAQANRAILEDLGQGVTSIVLRLDAAFRQGEAAPDGILAWDADGLDQVLAGVMLDLAPVQLMAPGSTVPAARALLELLRRRGHAPATVTADLGLDPLGAVALGRADPTDALPPAFALVRQVADEWGRLGLLRVDGELYHAAGASEAQELAAAIASGIQYLREGEAVGLEPASLAGRIGFTLAADADLFLTLAKCRAARRLWSRVTTACGADRVPMRLELRTASRMLTRRDPWVNMLRATVACLAGAVGGAEAITVTPFDAALGEPGRLGRRIARNVQLVLMEECNLHRVIDPAGGSPYVETLSQALAERAWPLVQAIEGEGGMLASLRQGIVQDSIAATCLGRLDDLAHRRRAITGVSSFPDLDERPLPEATPDLGPLLERAAAALPPRVKPAATVAALTPMRLAEGYERLRDLSDLALVEHGQRPCVFVAAMGPLTRHGAEASFVQNALAAGGIEAITSPPLEGGDAAAAAFAASGTRIACLCGIDRADPAAAGPIARALLDGGAIAIYAAGRPDPALQELGIDGFVHTGANILGLLEDLHSLARGEAS
ncbi:MAG: methylmalonyl-CoA mutase family protein [Geminicoccaceae bacterium]